MKYIFTFALSALFSFSLTAQCNSAIWLECSQTLVGRTISSTSNFSIANYDCPTGSGNNFQGRDDVYQFVLDKQTDVTIRLNPNENGYGGNLGLFLLNNCSPANCILAEDVSGNQPVITASLSEGHYYIVVENLNPGSVIYDIELNCGCSCSPQNAGFEYGEQRLCETFEQYNNNDNISANSAVRWKKWSTNSNDAVITQAGGSQQLWMRSATNYEPDVFMNLFSPSGASVTAGRYRLSFNMTVAPGKVGVYHIFHTAPSANGANSNEAYKVVFYPSGSGSLTLGTMPSTAAYFSYTVGAPTDVMQILDLDNNVAELWINHEFVYSWPFDTGSPSNSGALALVNFDAHPSTLNNQALDYKIDDICFTSKFSGEISPCALVDPIPEDICIKNGQQYEAAIFAGCDLYNVELESQPCANLCDDATWMECSQTLTNQSFDEFSNFSIPDYDGCLPNFTDVFLTEDKVYQFELTETTEVTVTIETINGENLALFILDNCSPSHCTAFSADNSGYHSLTNTLQPGRYYIVVEDQSFGELSFNQFNITLSCNCTCSETIYGHTLHCESFESFQPNENLASNSNRWHVWSSAVDDVPVSQSSGNKFIRIANAGTYEPDIWMNLFPASNTEIVDGRYRLSFDMTVAPGKAGNYYVQHVPPNVSGSGQVTAYRVIFNPNGSGQLVFVNQGNAVAANFTYANGVRTNVMQILDLNNQIAELWIDHEFIYSWPFNMDGTGSNALADINFDAHPASLDGQDFDYIIDNLCFKSQYTTWGICQGIALPEETCIKNGEQYYTTIFASCALYDVALESIPCLHVCDYGGTLIYRGDSKSGSLDQWDNAPALLESDPNVELAYDGIVPADLKSDVFVFYNANGGPINLRFNNNGNPNTKCFVYTCHWREEVMAELQEDSILGRPEDCIRGPHYIGVFSNPSPTQDMFIPLNSCADFYYFVVTGSVGATYSGLNITPSGPCQVNPPVINCETTLNGVISGAANTTFSTSGTAYNQCYNGVRAYTGAEKFYQFTLTEAKEVTITLNSTAPMGIFLYNFICGLQCIAFGENTVFNPEGKITAILYPGTYYIIVDKANTAGSNNFSLRLDCDDFSNVTNLNTFIIEDAVPCIPEGNQAHQVGIYNTAAAFDPNDKVMFRYPDNEGFLITNPGLTQLWGPLNESIKYFELEGDSSLFPDKCAYAEGDTFLITVYQAEPGQDRFTEYIAQYTPSGSPGVTAGNAFQNDGISLITQLKEGDSKNFVLNPPIVTERDTNQGTYPLVITTDNNEQWLLEEAFPVTWLSLIGPSAIESESVSGIGQDVVGIKLLKNNSEITRTTYLRVSLNSNSNLYQKFVKVSQLGSCNPNPSLNVTATPSTLCGSGNVVLTANVAPGMQDMFSYKWSNNDSTYFADDYLTATTTYTVTITNVDCFVTKTATATVVVNTLPGQPVNPVNRTICQGTALTQPLSVSLPAGNNLLINWYDQPVGGNLVKQNSTTYSPPNLISSVFYAETKSTLSSMCVSAQRTAVTLTVNPVPTLNVSPPSCGADLKYSVSASTTGTDITATAGIKTVANGIYTFSQIPSGTSVILTARYSGNNFCTYSDTIFYECNCVIPVPPPVFAPGSPVQVCTNEAIPPLQVSAQPGLKVYWFNTASGGTALPNGSDVLVYTPANTGTYYVEARDPVTNCSSTRTEIVLIPITPPVLNLVNTNCYLDLVNGSHYSVTFTSSSSDLLYSNGVLSNPSGNTYILSEISLGTDVLIYANPGTFCNSELYVNSPICACPAIAAPINPVNVVICSDEVPAPLQVQVLPGYQVFWFNQPTLGEPLPGGINTTQFTPAFPGLYYAEARDMVTGCKSSVRTQVLYQVNELPDIMLDSIVCIPVGEKYNLYFHAEGEQVTSSFGSPISAGNGAYYIAGIPGATSVILHATYTSTGCDRFQTIASPGCLCQVAAPVSLGNKIICEGDDLPALNVTVGAGLQALWYASTSATQPLASGNTYTPLQAGTYYVKARDPLTNCISNIAIPVSLSIQQAPIVHAGVDQNVCFTANVLIGGSVQIASGSGVWSSSLTNGSFFPNNGINAVSYDPPPSATQDFILILTSVGAQAPCPEVSDSILIHVNPLPTFSLDVNSFYCSPDRQTGYVTFMSNALSVSTNSPYQINNIAPQKYQITITDIADYNSFALNLSNGACLTPIVINENIFSCPCSSIVLPFVPDSINYCTGDVLPVLQPAVPAGLVLKWYDSAFAANPVFIGSTYAVSGPGQYYMQLYDSISDCSSLRRSVTIVEHSKPVASAGGETTICPGTPTVLNALLNGVNETYHWSSNQAASPISYVAPLQNTVYTLTVTNTYGCSSTDTVQISVWPAVSGQVEQLIDLQCYGELLGSLKWIPATGTAPFQYNWSVGSSSVQVDNLGAGTYTITVTDSHLCADTVLYLITQPDEIVLSSYDIQSLPDGLGTITVHIAGGTPPYQYEWSREGFELMEFDSIISGLLEANYLLLVEDQNGCSFTFPFIYVPVNEIDLKEFVHVSPNPTSGVLNIKFDIPYDQNIQIQLLDVLGREILEKNTQVGSTESLAFDLSMLPSAIYLLMIKMENVSTIYRISLKK